MYRYIFLFLFALYSCQNNPASELHEITIDIKTDSIYATSQNDSIFDKQVIVKNYFNLLDDSNNIYMVQLYFQGPDSLISFWGGFSEKSECNKARYHWTSDSSINMTLFNAENDSSKAVFLIGSMDGKTGRNGYLE